MAYSLATSYMGESLLSGFDWVNGTDPSNGFVAYQGREDAEAQGLYSMDEKTQVVRLGVDSTNKYNLDEGRPSIRIESKESYDYGLFIADFLHMPPSQCGLWPAFWSYGSDWPRGGELDIIEGANTAHNNIISAHTAEGCSQDPALKGQFNGQQRNTDCFIGDQNIGCGFDPPATSTNTYGDGFNAAGGGVYAVDWNSEHIRVWHFARDDIPADIESKTPSPDTWGPPHALFGGSSCDVDSYFKDMSLVLNINFCGDYGNAAWGNADSCTDYGASCPEYVANNPEAFANAYWDVKYIDVYSFDPTNQRVSALPESSDLAVPTNPASILGHAHLGCFGSESNFRTFNQIDDAPDMTLEQCIKLCEPITYAAVTGTKCLCAESLDSQTRAVDAGNNGTVCSNPCPGNAEELCGGPGYLTVYASVEDEENPQPPPMAGAVPQANGRFVVHASPAQTCHDEMTPTPIVLPKQTDAGVLPVTPIATPGAAPNSTSLPVPVAAAVDRRGPGKMSVVVGVLVMGLMMVI